MGNFTGGIQQLFPYQSIAHPHEAALVAQRQPGHRFALNSFDVRVDSIQERQPLGGDPGDGKAAVFFRPTAFNEPLPFQPVEQTGHVRGASD